MSLNAQKTASLLIQMGNILGDSNMDNLKLNKMLYFAQGHSLAETGDALFDDQIEAWDHGPVVSRVYHTYKDRGFEHITTPKVSASFSDATPDELKILHETYKACLNCTGGDLESLSHAKGGPWRKYYGTAHNAVIPQCDIKSYFGSRDVLAEIPQVLQKGYENTDSDQFRYHSERMNAQYAETFTELAK